MPLRAALAVSAEVSAYAPVWAQNETHSTFVVSVSSLSAFDGRATKVRALGSRRPYANPAVLGWGECAKSRSRLPADLRTLRKPFLKSSRPPFSPCESIQSLVQIPPLAAKRGLEAPEVIDGHIPRAGFNPLQRAQVNIGAFRQLFLRQFRTQPETVNVASDDVVWF